MQTYIALLRGINVGGHHKVPMAILREVLTKANLQNVQTYIQSGNVIFQSEEKNKKALEKTIHKAIQEHFQFDISVLVRTREGLQVIFNASPFSEEIKTDSYYILLQETPNTALVALAMQKEYENEAFYIINNCLYFYSAVGYGKSKFNAKYFERILETPATARNYNTMCKLLSLSE